MRKARSSPRRMRWKRRENFPWTFMMHHLVGMDASEYVIAINKDEKAAIFEAADPPVVGDFRKILPPFIKEIRAKRTQECSIQAM